MDYVMEGNRRRLEFEETLLGLMKEIPYESITVKDIAQRMNFVRKTFYHYYSSKKACLESLTDRLIMECNLHLTKTLPADATLYQFYEGRLLFWIEHRDFLEVIIRNGLSTFFLERLLMFIRNEDQAIQEMLRTDLVDCDEDILFFYVSGEVCLLLKWCGEGFVLPVHEMVTKRLRLVHEPLLPPDVRI